MIESKNPFVTDLTLRDYFAGLAMQGMVAYGDVGDRATAEAAYIYADAMLAERGKADGAAK